MAHLLAIESAGSSCSAAVLRHGGETPALLSHLTLPPSRGQADQLVLLIEAVLEVAGLGYGELDLVAVDQGPGGFTGVRTGVAAARALALAARLPVLPVTSLEALAAGVRPKAGASVLAVLDARRGEVYAQAFDDRLRPQGEPRASTPEAAATGLPPHLHLVGSGAPLIRRHLPDGALVMIEPMELDARLVAEAVVRRHASGVRAVAGFDLRPLYLRAPDARPPAARFARAQAAAAP